MNPERAYDLHHSGWLPQWLDDAEGDLTPVVFSELYFCALSGLP